MTPVSPRSTIFSRKINEKIAYHVALGRGLHSNFGVGVDLEASVKDTVRDLVAHLVGVTLTNRFRSEEDMVVAFDVH